MELFKRENYLRQIWPFVDKPLIKVLTGQRRTGKSYLLLQMMDRIRQENPMARLIYVNKEEMEFDAIKNYQDLYEYVVGKAQQRHNYLFVDEIQEIEGFEKALRSLLLKGNFDLYCTGSNAQMLSGELATLLSGRYVEFPVHSLSYGEFLQFHGLANGRAALWRFLKHGGMPFLIHLPDNDKVVFEYLKSIYNTIFFKDIISRYNIRNMAFLTDLVKFLASHCGSVFSTNSIAKYLKAQQIKVSYDLIVSYLAFLETAYVVQRVKRTDLVGKKLFEIGEKVFFEDVGLRNALAGFRPDDMGQIMENVVHSHLRFCGYNVLVGVFKNAEVDFVAEKNNEKIYVQVAYLLQDAQTIEREFGNLLQIDDNYPKYVVSMDEMESINTHRGIEHVRLDDFLLREL